MRGTGVMGTLSIITAVVVIFDTSVQKLLIKTIKNITFNCGTSINSF